MPPGLPAYSGRGVDEAGAGWAVPGGLPQKKKLPSGLSAHLQSFVVELTGRLRCDHLKLFSPRVFRDGSGVQSPRPCAAHSGACGSHNSQQASAVAAAACMVTADARYCGW